MYFVDTSIWIKVFARPLLRPDRLNLTVTFTASGTTLMSMCHD